MRNNLSFKSHVLLLGAAGTIGLIVLDVIPPPLGIPMKWFHVLGWWGGTIGIVFLLHWIDKN